MALDDIRSCFFVILIAIFVVTGHMRGLVERHFSTNIFITSKQIVKNEATYSCIINRISC